MPSDDDPCSPIGMLASSARTGYLGFQDLGGDCWFKNIVLESSTARNGSIAVSSTHALLAESRQELEIP